MDQLHWNSWTESVGTLPSEMTEVMEDRDVRRLSLKLLPRKLYGKADNEEGRQKTCLWLKRFTT